MYQRPDHNMRLLMSAVWLMIGATSVLIAVFWSTAPFQSGPNRSIAAAPSAPNPPASDAKDELGQLVERIEQSALGAMIAELNYPAGYPLPRPFIRDNIDTLKAIEAMNLSVTLISTTRRAYFLERLGDRMPEPGSDPRLCFDYGYGLCGNHVAAFAELLTRLGIRHRPVQFFYMVDGRRYSHIASEVFLQGAWRLFDPHYGRFWTKQGKLLELATLDDLHSNFVLIKEISNQTNLWNIFHSENPQKDAFLSSSASLLRDSKGTVYVSSKHLGVGELTLEHLPGYIGDNLDDNSVEGVSFEIAFPDGVVEATFVFGAIAGCSKEARLCAGPACSPISQTVRLKVSGKSKIEIRHAAKLCYATIDSIRWSDFEPSSR